jgi:uncharacterized protein (DUF1499 family)
MTKLLKISMALILLFISFTTTALFVLAWKSQQLQPPGLVDGKLKACPNKPNCLCSESLQNFQANTEAVKINSGKNKTPLRTFEDIILKMGGEIVDKNETYLSSTFKSELFGFIDDLELRWDASNNVVHLRSSSRVGYSDMGKNAKRVESLKSKYADSTNSH